MSEYIHEIPKRAYVNVMELLVAEEVERQLKQLSPRVLKYVKRVEVETYALNRLPSLYASSEKGWQHQYEKAKRELRSQIKDAVRQALAAVQVDPIRISEPLRINNDEESQAALKVLRQMFQQDDLSWDLAIKRLRLLLKRSEGEVPASYAPPPPPSASPDANHRRHWRPGTYGAEVSWQAKHPKPGTPSQRPIEPSFDWDDARYQK